MTLGGRGAEDLFIGSVTTGGSDDLKKVTQTAYAMASVYGMSDKIGLFNYSNDDPFGGRMYSEDVQQEIDDVTKEIIDGQYSRVKSILKEKEHLVHALTEGLFAKETLVYADLVEVLGKRPVPMNEHYEKFVLATSNQISTEHEEITTESTNENHDDDDKNEDSSSGDEVPPVQPAPA